MILDFALFVPFVVIRVNSASSCGAKREKHFETRKKGRLGLIEFSQLPESFVKHD
jgi:hypothetical protein